MESPHEPVLVREVLDSLTINPGGIYVDGTVGPGGHSWQIGKRLNKEGLLICLDIDPGALEFARKRLSSLSCQVRAIKESYSRLGNVLNELGLEKVDGILVDLGMSSYQLEESGRGFSFSKDEPLDMRMDPENRVTAAGLLNSLSLRDLEDIFRIYGEEKRARTIAKAIVNTRKKAPITRASQLAELIESLFPRSPGRSLKHPATKTFQALRIAVNKELENLNEFLDSVPEWIKTGGRLVILSYHSLEDRLVKQAMMQWEKGCICPPRFPQCVCGQKPLFKRVYKKAVRPQPSEIKKNPRARSAILRAAERI